MTAALLAGSSTLKRSDWSLVDSVTLGDHLLSGFTEAPPKVMSVLLSAEGAVKRRIVAFFPVVVMRAQTFWVRSLLTRTTRRSPAVPRTAKARSDEVPG